MSLSEMERLREVVAKLRDPKDGCPWDLEQTHKSLLKYLMEESYEFMHAVEDGNYKKMEDELGDVLLQVVLHSQLASEESKFDLNSVAKTIADKMVRRHPHVFTDNKAKDVAEIKQRWEEIKKAEKANEESLKKYEICNELLSFPALTSAAKIGKKTNKINFDWEDYTQVMYKVEEEWQELKEELTPGRELNKERVQEEMGDLLFSVAQLARHLDLDPEITLREANLKFKRRFNQLEDIAREEGIVIRESSQDELETLWSRVKEIEKSN
ncbi:nucleoside triphosphate pyrophosphohydrolase [Halobacteriovorax sp. RZ-2]|uniref:nucleoside triphosphate pyrophosphohydrolase n=1 Tax=unclassified Halobacteriovorax TaxID=2639665 RepID=UPI00371DC421